MADATDRSVRGAEQPIAGYRVDIRYRDARDKPLDVDGSPEDSTSFMGKGFICEPKPLYERAN